MVLSWKIASLLGKQINTPAVSQEVYVYDTKPENHEFAY